MSSDVQSALQLQQLNDYTSVVTLTAVIYDYTLTLSGEVDYIWHRPWTCVSTMFVLVRYIGLCWAILSSLMGSTFMPASIRMYVCTLNPVSYQNQWQSHRCTISFLIQGWMAPVFFAAFDLVMILWVYAMWNQSKRILYILLFSYVPVSLSFLITTGIFINPSTNLTVIISQLIDFSVCNGSFTNAIQVAHVLSAILQFALSGTILTLTVTRTLKQSLELYQATKQWKPNKYYQQLLKDAVLYFLVNVLRNISAILLKNKPGFDTAPLIVLYMVPLTIIPLMMPRFIISIRELYDHDLHRHCLQRIDSEFGVLSQLIASENALVSEISFVDVNPGEADSQEVHGGAGDSEAIQLEVLGNGV